MKTWFKFYGQEFLSDPKMLSLTALERSLWLTVLCLASSSDEEGVIKYIDEHKIKILTNLSPLDDEWQTADGFLEKFEELGMIKLEEKKIILSNFNKRQETNLTDAERAKRYRENHRHVTNVTKKSDENNAREEKNRKEKRRIEKNIETREVSTRDESFRRRTFEEITQEDMDHVAEMYRVPKAFVYSKHDDLKNYLAKTGKEYKDYLAALKDWVKRDAEKIAIATKTGRGVKSYDATDLLHSDNRQGGDSSHGAGIPDSEKSIAQRIG